MRDVRCVFFFPCALRRTPCASVLSRCEMCVLLPLRLTPYAVRLPLSQIPSQIAGDISGNGRSAIAEETLCGVQVVNGPNVVFITLLSECSHS
jgi:hypothetical protein